MHPKRTLHPSRVIIAGSVVLIIVALASLEYQTRQGVTVAPSPVPAAGGDGKPQPTPTKPTEELPPRTARIYLPLVRQDPPPLAYGPKGLAGPDPSGLVSHDVYYNWGVQHRTTDPSFARMVWCFTDPFVANREIPLAASNDHAAGIVGRVWLIGNEPANHYFDSWGGQCGYKEYGPNDPVHRNPTESARRYVLIHDIIKANDPNARVFSPAILSIGVPSTGRWWFEAFIQELRNLGRIDTLDGIAVHAYPRWSVYCPSPTAPPWPYGGNWCMDVTLWALEFWYQQYHVGLGLGHLPIWITEAGSLPFFRELEATFGMTSTTASQLSTQYVMHPMIAWFDSPRNPGYDALFWYKPDQPWSFPSNAATLVTNASHGWELTPLGERWEAWSPKLKE